MPTHRYACEKCGNKFDIEYVRPDQYNDIICPRCASLDVQRFSPGLAAKPPEKITEDRPLGTRRYG
jgi:putative FmdB family regulatory protein